MHLPHLLPNMPADFPPRLAGLAGLDAGNPVLPPSLFAPPPMHQQNSDASPASPSSISGSDRPTPILDPIAMHRKLLTQQQQAISKAGLPSAGLPSSAAAPSLYEMAALTHELDTHAVTTKVKEILLANNVGQKVSSQRSLAFATFKTNMLPFSNFSSLVKLFSAFPKAQ